MRTKLIKSIQMILITLIIIVAGAIIAGSLSNNDSMAYSDGERCSVCLADTLKWGYNSDVHGYYCNYCKEWYGATSHDIKNSYEKTGIYMSHTAIQICVNCDYKTEKTEKCELVNFEKVDENKHVAICKKCQDCYSLPHVDNNNNGICDDCLAVIKQNTPSTHVCSEHSKQEVEIYNDIYHDYYTICTICENPTPQWQKREPHNFGEFTSKGSTEHSKKCKVCGYELIQKHEEATHENGGKCTGCGYQYQTHKKSTTLARYTDITETMHTPIYKCSQEGCNQVFKENAENHSFGRYTSNGVEGHSKTCKKCGYELIQKHEGATHENGGKCTECGYQYQNHKKSTTLLRYTDITETMHTPIYKCSQEGCNETFKGNAQSHNYQNGKCACGKVKIEEPVEIKVESEKYKIDPLFVLNVQPKTQVSNFKSNIKTNGTQIDIYNKNNQPVDSSAKIGTGMKLVIRTKDRGKIFTIIVKGDANGDGKADFKDVIKVNEARLNKKSLEKIYSMAVDVTGDGRVDFKDLVKINKFRLNKVTEL